MRSPPAPRFSRNLCLAGLILASLIGCDSGGGGSVVPVDASTSPPDTQTAAGTGTGVNPTATRTASSTATGVKPTDTRTATSTATGTSSTRTATATGTASPTITKSATVTATAVMTDPPCSPARSSISGPCNESEGCFEVKPTGSADDSSVILITLGKIRARGAGKILLRGNFVTRRTIVLPSNLTWVLDGSLKLGDNVSASLDRVGVKTATIDTKRPTALTEVLGGAQNIDMSGGVYDGNRANNVLPTVRLLSFVAIKNSCFHDMTIQDASDDNFTIGSDSQNNQLHRLVSKRAGGNALTDKGSYNKWYDSVAEDCDSDGWTPKSTNSEYHRCIGRKNDGPGWGLYARLDGSPMASNIGAKINGNKFVAIEAYDNARCGISLDVSGNSGPGAELNDNSVQGLFHHNRMCGVMFRNVYPGGKVQDNSMDVVTYSNTEDGVYFEGPISGTTGYVIAFKNRRTDIRLDVATGSVLTVYTPTDQARAVIESRNSKNTVNRVSFSCSDPLPQWNMKTYCSPAVVK